MLRALPLMLFALSATAQQTERTAVGTLTGTVGGEEVTFVIVEPREGPSSGFERRDGVVDVRLLAQPDRTPVEDTPTLEVRFLVTGMGPTADAYDAEVRYTGRDGDTLSTREGSAEVSMTAFGMEEDEVTVTGNFSSQLREDPRGLAELAIEGDFQASIRQEDFGEVD